MTLQEANALPIPEQFKKTPNIYRLAQIIRSTGDADRIMAVLPLIITPSTKPTEKEETA